MEDSGYYSTEGQSETGPGSAAESARDDIQKEGDENEEEAKAENQEEEEVEIKMTAEEARKKAYEMLHDGSIEFPEDFTDEELHALLESVEFPEEISNETLQQYHNDCVALIKEELVPDPEKPDEEDEESVVKLTPEFIADRLSDLQPVEGEHLTFALTSFAVQEAEIYDIKALSEYQALTYIKLKTNIISDASPLNGLPRLRELYLNENKLVSFTNISLPSLEVLDLSSNQLRTVGHLFLPKLKKLNLAQNKICYIAPSAFSELVDLTQLTLTENKLKTFKPDVFKSLSKLETLLLDQNQITDITEGLFDGLAALKKLVLNENGVENITGISSLVTLENLEMQQSQLEEIEKIKPFIDLKALKSLNLDGSPVDGVENFRSEIILMLPWLETLDEENISFAERQEALQLDEERKAEAERERQEAEREAAERAAEQAENEEENRNEAEDQQQQDENNENTDASYSTYYESEK